MLNVLKKIFLTSSLLAAFTLSLQAGTSLAEADMNLATLRWQHRIIIIQEYDDRQADKIEALLNKNSAEIADRDIVWYLLRSDELSHNHNRYHLAEPSVHLSKELETLVRDNRPHSTLLIGKDGGIKLRKNELMIDEIFNVIDAMPMRVQEMKRDKKSKTD